MLLSDPDLVQGDDLTMTCRVESKPLSTIQLYNVTDNNTPLDTVNSENQVQIDLIDLHCLDTGDYRFTATNDVPNQGNTVEKLIHLDVKCKLKPNQSI